MAKAGKTVAVVLADDAVDIVQESGRDLNKHVRDLKRVGFVVKVKHFKSWAEATAYEDKRNG